MATTKIKASDRSKVAGQLVAPLKKEYGSRAPQHDFNVLDTILFGICLENNTYASAEKTLQNLKDSFFEYNEIRVSSITELQDVFQDLSQPEWRAQRVRETLQYVFEGRYSYDLEDFKKKTLDSAEKYLTGITSLSPFVISHTLLVCLGSHVFPVDDEILKAGLWLGLLEEDSDTVSAADQLKAAVRKADVPLKFYLLNSLAAEEKFLPIFAEGYVDRPEDPTKALQSAPGRLKDLLAGKFKPAAASKSTKKSTTKSTAKKSSKKSAKKSSAKKSTKKSASKKK